MFNIYKQNYVEASIHSNKNEYRENEEFILNVINFDKETSTYDLI